MPIIFLVVIISFNFFTVNGAGAITVERKGVDAFWSVSAALRNGKEPDPALWQSLIHAKGYRLLKSATGKGPVAIKDALHLAFLPDNKNAREKILSDGNTFAILELEHLVSAVNNKDAINAYIDNYQRHKRFERSRLLAFEYLPKSAQKIAAPTVSFIIFGLNAHANDLGVTLDAQFLMRMPEVLQTEIVAHELHHYYLDQLKLKSRKPFERNTDFAQLAYNIHKEGIADLMDKKNYLANGHEFLPRELIKAHQELFASALDVLSSINSEFRRLKQSGQLDKKDSINWQLVRPAGGHASGYYLAKVIKNNNLLDSLLENIEDPYEIFFHYERAQKGKANVFHFDPELLAYLRELQSRNRS